ncbi:MAG: acyl dehydratase [Halieaceae bacterium]|jgi:acyl dehydratase
MALYWQDLQVGDSFTTTKCLTLTREDILAFAAEFDPQPYHMDKEAAESSIFGGLCASGWQVSALMMRLLTDTFHAKGIAILGVASVQEVRWKLPVFADDSLNAQVSITDRTAESGLAGVGTVDVAVQVSNQNNKPVITVQNRLLIAHEKVEVSHAE